MRPFAYHRPETVEDAVAALSAEGAHPLAGGTTMVDLMKLDVRRPVSLVDISALGLAGVRFEDGRIRLGALATMSEVAGDERLTAEYPLLTEALQLAASPQLRNVATLGGNVLQRTRCPYFRDVSYPCNKREPGSGCAAIDGYNRLHAVLGVSDSCIASYPGDFAVSLAALGAHVETAGPQGGRSIPFEDLHRLPGDSPEVETVLEAGELITAIVVERTPLGRASTYYKVRDRESYAFANASAAVALAMEGETVSDARLALGGVASKPWRARAAEDSLRGERLTESAARRAGEIAVEGATTFEHNAFKVPLAVETVIEALMSAKARA